MSEDGLCQGVYDQGRQDGYSEGRRAHVWHSEEDCEDDDEDKKTSWRAVQRGRNDDSGSSDSSSSEDSEDSTSGASSESDIEDEDGDKRTREQIYEEIAQLENELAELEASDQEDRPHPTDG